MIYSSPSPKMARKLPGNDFENEHQLSPPLSPKRSFAQDGRDPVDSKRRHVLLEGLHGQNLRRRAPLDPLALSDRENNSNYDMEWLDPDLHLSISISPSCPDLRSFSRGKSWGRPCSATGESMASSGYTWPPAFQVDSPVQNLVSRRSVAEYDILCCPDDHLPSRRAFSTSSLPLSENLTMLDAPQTEYGSPPQSTLTHINSFPYDRCPTGDLWPPTIAEDALIGDMGSAPLSTMYVRIDGGRARSSSLASPPGLSPYRPKPTHRGSDTNLIANSSASLSLSSGSQPLASEQPKPVPPIGAERSRVMRIISSRSPSEQSRLSLTRDKPTDDPSFLRYPPLPSSKLQSKFRTFLENEKSVYPPTHNPPPLPSPISQEDFCRFLRQATNNKFAPKIFSPLNPLRNSTPPSHLAVDPAYIARMPSLTNMPSLRYTQIPAIRVRTTCDIYQSSRFEEVCAHCHECKRDSVGKRLLAFKYRRMTRQKHRSYTFGLPIPGHVPMDMLSGIECDERSLWNEVAAVTRAEPFPCSGSSAVFGGSSGCGVEHGGPTSSRAPDIHALEDDFLEVSDEDMLTHMSLREVSVY
ncbi:hypothetical protein EDC04DRAFT_2655429 [Pisolithus marmoratus]|nr:hypothetical protein EDC04DRAFT_2655429 [Pisolithus marmoratus]